MVVSISSHADLQALQDRSDEPMLLKLVSLDSVRVASGSYELVRSLIDQRSHWRCPQIDLLSRVASVALELDKIKHDLFPPILVQFQAEGATLTLEEGGSSLRALLELKNSAATLVGLAKDAKFRSLVEKNVLLGEVKCVGVLLEDDLRRVMKGDRKFTWFGARVSGVLDLVNVVLSTPVHFPDPN